MVFGLMAIGMSVDKYIQNLGMAVGLMAIGMPAGKIQNLGNRHGSWPRNIFKTSAIGMAVSLIAIGMPAGKYIQTLGMAVGLMAIGMPAGKIQNLGNR
ncbi:MAG: hypothetical protein QOH50_4979 [Kribbellaceae bacterium]|nr:hypothetical protein [Kribbellaceae bacterium]